MKVALQLHTVNRNRVLASVSDRNGVSSQQVPLMVVQASFKALMTK